MIWFAIYDSTSGKLISVASRVTSSLPSRLKTKEYDSKPDLATTMWDETSREFVPRPEPVMVSRIDDLLNDSRSGWKTKLLPDEIQDLRSVMKTMLGDLEFRTTEQDVLRISKNV
jgi:hypothetical protein